MIQSFVFRLLRLFYMSYIMRNGGGGGERGRLIHLRKVSTHVSLRGQRRLTWVETFRYL